jgi:hypothetical protein
VRGGAQSGTQWETQWGDTAGDHSEGRTVGGETVRDTVGDTVRETTACSPGMNESHPSMPNRLCDGNDVARNCSSVSAACIQRCESCESLSLARGTENGP